MPITRRDIVSKQFTGVGGGYASDEVDAYLDDIADDIDLRDDLLITEKRRVGALTTELRRMDIEVSDLRKKAGRIADAEAEAKELLEQARLQAKRLMAMARDEARKVVEEAVEQGRLIVRKAGEQSGTPNPLKDRLNGAFVEPPARRSADEPVEQPAPFKEERTTAAEEQSEPQQPTPEELLPNESDEVETADDAEFEEAPEKEPEADEPSGEPGDEQDSEPGDELSGEPGDEQDDAEYPKTDWLKNPESRYGE